MRGRGIYLLAMAASTVVSVGANSRDSVGAQMSESNSTDIEKFPSPPEILSGALPAEEPWLSEAVAMRRALGLSDDYDLVRDLLTTPGSQRQWQTYGAVLTPEEESKLAVARRHHDQWLAISAELSELSGWAGSRLVEDDAPGVLRAFEVWYGKSDAESFVQALHVSAAVADAEFDVVGVQVGFSYKELEMLAAALRAALGLEHGDQSVQVDSEIASRIAPIIDALAGVDVVWVGLDSNDNGLVAYSLSLTESQNGSVLSDIAADLPGVELRVPDMVELDTGPNVCVNAGCPPVMSGNEIEYRGSNNYCTIGLPLSVSGDLRWSTAGHCDGANNFDPQRIRGGSAFYPGYFDFTRDMPVSNGTRLLNGYVSGSTVDITTLTESDFRVTNRLRIGTSAHTKYAGWVPQNQIPNDGSYRVCKSGANTGYSCAAVTNRSETVTTPDGVLLHEQIRSTYIRSGGDSGAPVVAQANPALAVGMHSGRYQGHTSAGAVTNLTDVIPGGSVYLVPDPRRDWILSLYEHAVERLADSTGYSTHRNTLLFCSVTTARQVAWPFYTGVEFTQGTLGSRHSLSSVTGRQIRVEKLYRGLLGRASDTNGFNAHYNNLTSNPSEQTWQSIVNSFLNSAEFGMRVNGGGAGAYLGQIC